MIDHLSIGVSDIGRSRVFYDSVLGPLGYRRLTDADGASGYGEQAAVFWIGVPLDASRPVTAANGTHFGFTVPSKEAVGAFYRAALAAGGRSDGEPGPRAAYGPDYYGAFCFDPDGHKIEAVCRMPNP